MEHEEKHMHGHEHEHGDHHGEHLPEGMSSAERTKTMLGYLLAHNEHHAEEIREMAQSLAAGGQSEAAGLVLAAAERFDEGNKALKEALALL